MDFQQFMDFKKYTSGVGVQDGKGQWWDAAIVDGFQVVFFWSCVCMYIYIEYVK
jgi:hypothetical protein